MTGIASEVTRAPEPVSDLGERVTPEPCGMRRVRGRSSADSAPRTPACDSPCLAADPQWGLG